MKRQVAFLFLGETLLIPHLYPIVEALAAAAPALPIELWVSTSVHEHLLRGWTAALGPNVRIRRAPGFRTIDDDADGRNPELPAKLPMLGRLAPLLWRTRIVVCAEQTSLWLPTLLPMPARFVKVPHGAGTLMKRDDRRRRAAHRTLVPSERERLALAGVGVDPARIAVTGYAKTEFAHRSAAADLFATPRPTVLYNPHWQQHRSSWWRWGTEAVRAIVESGRYNLIFAPHQRLVERSADVGALCAELAGDPHVHCDFTSFATVDGSYTAAADIYLGDTSSQVVEFIARPRPTLFLDAQEADWQSNPAYDMWRTGEVLTDIDDLLPALDRAAPLHATHRDTQIALTTELLGVVDGHASARAAATILAALDARD
jgi:hypothetical protein